MNIISLSNSSIALIIALGVLAIGYMLGRIDIKGVRLGSSGVFIVAIIVGCILGSVYDLNDLSNKSTLLGSINNIATCIKNLGLVLFIVAVGYTAGSVFIKTLKNGGLNFVILSVTVIFSGLIVTMIIYFIDKNLDIQSALGLMMGALTTTPGLSSTELAFAGSESVINTANAIAYPFGVLGACLFVQIMPKFFQKNLEDAKQSLSVSHNQENTSIEENLIEFDKMGLTMFCLAGIVGIFLGAITIPYIDFKLTTTGGCLISGIIFSLIGKIGKVSLKVPKSTLSVLKEVGLVFFLYGSGISGGFEFIPTISNYPIYFLYGILITSIPMIVGFVLALKVFKMDILTNLGAITGAMTSTPALGALEQVAQTDDVSACYTATYPVALFLLVIIPQIIKIFF